MNFQQLHQVEEMKDNEYNILKELNFLALFCLQKKSTKAKISLAVVIVVICRI